MSYQVPRVQRPYFGHNMHQENSHPNFQRRLPAHIRPMYSNRANFSRHEQSFNNSEQHWCETCDRGFNTLQQLEGHKQQHQKCNIDGCQFVAHPKVITKHIQMQHSSGLYKRIAKLDNPEEIKKWIEERKKKYPTKDNIEKKSAEIKEKIERGEKMGLRQDRFGRNKKDAVKRKNMDNNGNHNIKKHMRQNNFEKSKPNLKNPKKEVKPKKICPIAPIDETRKLRPFAGIQNLDMDSDTNEETEQLDCNFVIEDDDCETLHKIEESKTVSEPSLCGALSSLICNYGSSDEENANINESTANIKEVTTKSNQYTIVSTENKCGETKAEIKTDTLKVVQEIKSDDDSGPEEVKVAKTISPEIAISDNVAVKEALKKSGKKEYKKRTFIRSKPKVPSTLLHKLLHREMQHERNVILQCVRYIVKNNYFDM